MKILNVVQGSGDWEYARLGRVTASAASRVLTPGGKVSRASTRQRYLDELLAEWALAYREQPPAVSYWTERGHDYEDEARAAIALQHDCSVANVGLIYQDESEAVACSPDGLIEDPPAGVELKCPMAATHLRYLLDGVCPPVYWPQIQFSLWCTGLPRWLFASYHPALPSFSLWVDPDPDYLETLSGAIIEFLGELAAAKDQLLQMGVSPQLGLST